MGEAPVHRFYTDLAVWWPLVSPPEEYREEADFAASLLASGSIPVRTVLELGSGGGHNASHLKRHFEMTLVDRSPEMLAVSRGLNPECEHLAGDMRTLRLDRSFDAVFVHDAVDYLVTEADLVAAADTAFAHCRPGGVAVLMPDHTVETFEPSTDHGGSDDHSGRGVRYLEWTWDPDPADTSVTTDYAFLLRQPNGTVEVVHETHHTGLFPAGTWIEILAAAGFSPRSIDEPAPGNRPPRPVFVGHRPR